MKDKTCIVWNYGTFFNVAKRLSKEFKTVYHYCPRSSNYPTINTTKIGDGYPNIQAVDEDDLWQLVHTVDLIVFPDVGDGGLQRFLRKKGYRVFGSELGDKLELDRSYFKKELKRIGLPVNPYKTFTDVDKLRDYLMSVDNKFIKISYFRGIAESFHHLTWKTTEMWWAHLVTSLSVWSHNFKEIIVEEPIESQVEIGTDRLFSNKQFLDTLLLGIEIKNKGYICKGIESDELPELLADIDEEVTELYNKFDVRSSISSEIRIPNKDVGYFIDSTMRFGYPPSTSMCLMFDNFGEVLYKMAGNEKVDVDLNWNYCAEIILYSEELTTEWLMVEYPSKYDDNVYLQQSCMIDGKHYVIPIEKSNVIGSVVAGADTLDEAIKQCLNIAENIKAEGIYYDKTVFDTAKEQLKVAQKLEVGFK